MLQYVRRDFFISEKGKNRTDRLCLFILLFKYIYDTL